ncbi:hypothetical protein [Psychromonas sp. SP041]|uniref:hypothetical protein n=1 Tax=Psychromonas sp. SP041 TaxID=1365007 RepID=UPI000471B937|nr:hypothetical protein [Psychromonas sp. SP041]
MKNNNNNNNNVHGNRLKASLIFSPVIERLEAILKFPVIDKMVMESLSSKVSPVNVMKGHNTNYNKIIKPIFFISWLAVANVSLFGMIPFVALTSFFYFRKKEVEELASVIARIPEVKKCTLACAASLKKSNEINPGYDVYTVEPVLYDYVMNSSDKNNRISGRTAINLFLSLYAATGSDNASIEYKRKIIGEIMDNQNNSEKSEDSLTFLSEPIDEEYKEIGNDEADKIRAIALDVMSTNPSGKKVSLVKSSQLEVEPASSDISKTEHAKAEINKAANAKIDTVKVKPAKVDTVKAKAVKKESVKTEITKADTVETKPSNKENVKVDTVKKEHATPSQELAQHDSDELSGDDVFQLAHSMSGEQDFPSFNHSMFDTGESINGFDLPEHENDIEDDEADDDYDYLGTGELSDYSEEEIARMVDEGAI